MIKITMTKITCRDVIRLWDEAFAHNVAEDIKEAIYYDQFKWHIFSYGKQKCLTGDEARQAFDAETKGEVYAVYQHLPHVFLYRNADRVIAEDFDSEQDIYLFDRQRTWTYVHTHESMCGPYFYKPNRSSEG